MELRDVFFPFSDKIVLAFGPPPFPSSPLVSGVVRLSRFFLTLGYCWYVHISSRNGLDVLPISRTRVVCRLRSTGTEFAFLIPRDGDPETNQSRDGSWQSGELRVTEVYVCSIWLQCNRMTVELCISIISVSAIPKRGGRHYEAARLSSDMYLSLLAIYESSARAG